MNSSICKFCQNKYDIRKVEHQLQDGAWKYNFCKRECFLNYYKPQKTLSFQKIKAKLNKYKTDAEFKKDLKQAFTTGKVTKKITKNVAQNCVELCFKSKKDYLSILNLAEDIFNIIKKQTETSREQ